MGGNGSSLPGSGKKDGALDRERLTYTVDQAAHALGISRSLCYELVRTGKLPTLRFGRRIVVPKRALERLLEEPERASGVIKHE